MSDTRITKRSLRDRRTGETDWTRLDGRSDEDIQAAVASDPDAAPLLGEEWMERVEVHMPRSKKLISIRLDPEVLEFFQQSGRNYQTRINAVLKAYVDARKRSA